MTQPPASSSHPRDPWRRALWWATAALMSLLLVLAASGIWLSTGYQPASSPSLAYADLQDAGPTDWPRQLHAVAASVAVLVAGAFAAVAIAVVARTRRARTPAIIGALGVVGLVAAASLTGYAIGWDHVGFADIADIAANGRGSGIWDAAFDESTRFVLVGGDEVSRQDYRLRVLWHLVAIPAAIVVLVSVLVRRSRPRNAAQE